MTDHKNAVTEARRTENIKRENDRWEAIDSKDAAERARTKRLQEDPIVGKKNEGGCPYNILSTQYHDTRSGLWLEHVDNMIKYKAELRQKHLAFRYFFLHSIQTFFLLILCNFTVV